MGLNSDAMAQTVSPAQGQDCEEREQVIMESKLNLRGMLRLDPVEDLLSSVLQRLNEQDRVLAEIKVKLEDSMGRQAAQDSLSELHRMIKSCQVTVFQYACSHPHCSVL